MPPNATPEQQEELRRHLIAQQQAVLLNAHAGAQGLRQNPGLGRGLVIPGGPNARPMPIRPNTGPNPMPGPIRFPNGVTATPEQMQIFKARQLAALQQAAGVQNGVPQTPQQMQRLRALQQVQQAQLNAAAQNAAAQNAGQTNTANGVADYIPFIAQANGAAAQGICS